MRDRLFHSLRMNNIASTHGPAKAGHYLSGKAGHYLSQTLTNGSGEQLATGDEARWAAVLEHDRAADGRFVYAVSSTGIYCRPSCASRRPRRDRVAFFDAPADARVAGYRACKRCKPDAADAAPDPWVEKIRRAWREARAFYLELIRVAAQKPGLANA